MITDDDDWERKRPIEDDVRDLLDALVASCSIKKRDSDDDDDDPNAQRRKSTRPSNVRRLLSSDDEDNGIDENEYQATAITVDPDPIDELHETSEESISSDAETSSDNDDQDSGAKKLRKRRHLPELGMPLSMVYIGDIDEEPVLRKKKRRPCPKSRRRDFLDDDIKSFINDDEIIDHFDEEELSDRSESESEESFDEKVYLRRTTAKKRKYVKRPKSADLEDLPQLDPVFNKEEEITEMQSEIIASNFPNYNHFDHLARRQRPSLSAAFQNLVSKPSTSFKNENGIERIKINQSIKHEPLTTQKLLESRARPTMAQDLIDRAGKNLAERFGIDDNDGDDDAPPPLVCADPEKRHKRRKTRPRRVKHDMLTKMKAVEMTKTHSTKQTARMLGLDYKLVRKWKKQEKQIREAIIRGDAGTSRVRLSNGALTMHAELEFRLISWMLQSTKDGYAPTRPEIQNKALLIRNELMPSPGQRLFNFKAGDSWVSRFIDKHKGTLGPWLEIRGLNYTPRQPKDPILAAIHNTAQKQSFVPKIAPKQAAQIQAQQQQQLMQQQQQVIVASSHHQPVTSTPHVITVAATPVMTSNKLHPNNRPIALVKKEPVSRKKIVEVKSGSKQPSHIAFNAMSAPTMVSSNTLQQQYQALSMPIYPAAFMQQNPTMYTTEPQNAAMALINLPTPATNGMAQYDLGVQVTSGQSQHYAWY